MLKDILKDIRFSEGNNANHAFNPRSLARALNVLSHGSVESSKAKIKDFIDKLGVNHSNPLEMICGLELSNVFYDFSVKLNRDYVKWCHFDGKCPTISVDMKNPAEEISSLIEVQTNNKLKNALKKEDMINNNNNVIITDVFYFYDNWFDFEFELIGNREFYNASGSVKVPFMFKKVNILYSENEKWKMIALPYKNKDALLLIATSKYGIDFLDYLDQNEINDLMSKTKEIDVSIIMPKFSISTTTSLEDLLIKFDLKSIFVPGNLVPMFDPSSSNFDKNSLVSRVLQKNIMKVDEKGTLAQTVTFIGFSGYSYDPPTVNFVVDKPFCFALVKEKTKDIIITGDVFNPTLE